MIGIESGKHFACAAFVRTTVVTIIPSPLQRLHGFGYNGIVRIHLSTWLVLQLEGSVHSVPRDVTLPSLDNFCPREATEEGQAGPTDSKSHLQPRDCSCRGGTSAGTEGRVGGGGPAPRQPRAPGPPGVVLSLRSGGKLWLSGLPTQHNLGDFPAVALQVTAFKAWCCPA